MRRRRRRKWKAPNDPTASARQVWAALFPREPWPSRWRVAWAGFMRGCSGLTLYSERRVLLNYGDANRKTDGLGVVDTLIHEFVHVRCGPSLRHGKEFRGLENEFRGRLGLRLRFSKKEDRAPHGD